ncbi:Pumilio y domain member 6 [Marasmius crinis-equi]|uniref:Pumilio y domain member 6 n=1 Tax=Marasmius crinis-equi TaxID=585013 RepID=A0ABR3FQZ3_9AGAR
MAPVSQKSSKKRSAKTQAGPSTKKIHLEKAEQPSKKRSQPITQVPTQQDDSEWESVDENDEFEGVEDEEDEAMDTTADGAPSGTTKDPNAVRESHKAQKALQEQRKAAKPHSKLLADAKRIWALARQKNIPAAERQKHVRDLMNVMRGKVKDIVFKHDASRIVQTVVKYGQAAERNTVAEELKGKYKDLAQNKYSKGHVLKLLLHREASSVLADAFELYANAYERSILLREFYGKETALFTSTNMTEAEKEKAKRGLSGVLEGADKDRRRRTLAALKEALDSIFNNPDKGAVTHAIVHRALWEYLAAVNESPEESEQEKLRKEIFESCQDIIPEMVHTKDGSRAVRELIARGSAKDRKQILKALKPHIERMCLDDEAQMVLFTAIDVIDDTKLVHKSVVTQMTESASTLVPTPQGRRALFYLLVPRTRRHFTPAQIVSLAETDEARTATSKKDPEVRASEIRQAASEALLSWVAEKGEALSREPGGSLVVTEVMLYADGDKSAAIQTLLAAISSPYPSTDPSKPHAMDLPHTSRLYKTLLQGGHFNHSTKSVQKAPSWDSLNFATQFVDSIEKEVALAMCLQGEKNGMFVISELCASLAGANTPESTEARQKLKEWFTSSVKNKIAAEDGKGKKLCNDALSIRDTQLEALEVTFPPAARVTGRHFEPSPRSPTTTSQQSSKVPGRRLYMALSEKAKGKQKALDPDPIAGPSTPTPSQQIQPNVPQTLVVRFTDDKIVDLEITVTEKDTVRDVKNTIRRERSELSRRRLRLIHSGRLLTDGTFLYSWLKKLDERQKRASAPEDGGEENADANAKSTVASWLHCSVGREIEQGEEELDDGFQTNQIQPARGFDRLASMGFSQSDIASIRRQFHIQNDSFLTGDDSFGHDDNYDEHARALEEQWIDSLDSTDNSLSPSSSSSSNSSAMQGIVVGFFFPFLPLFLNGHKPPQPIFWEDGTEHTHSESVVFSRATQMGLVAGFMINILFGMWRFLLDAS